jgi:trehalose synthase-fused probable maltokinase
MTSLPILPPAPGNRHPFEGPARALIERDLLLPYLRRQRWFGGKARRPQTARLVDWAPLGDAATGPMLALVEVTYGDGAPDRYHVPTVVAAGATAERVLAERPETAIAHVASRAALLCDAVIDDAACRTMLAASARDGDYATRQGGRVVARAIAAGAAGTDDESAEVSRFASTHSNSAVALGGRYLLKVFRRLEKGLNPDIEIGRFLARQTRRVRVPALVGSIEHVGPDEEPCALVLTQELVRSRTNAWEHALHELGDFFAQLDAAGAPSVAAAAAVTCAASAGLDTLGRRSAELHRALAADATHPDFAPTRATPDEVRALTAGLRRTAADVLGLLERQRPELGPGAADLAGRLLADRAALLDRIDRLGRAVEPYVKIRVHGDYHLGQVLHTDDDDFVILDFEGEPTRPLAERRARQSPLRDVAGMLRSFDYAAHAALATAAGADTARWRALEPWAGAWNVSAAGAFLRAYRDAARGADLLPTDAVQIQALLDLFLCDKAVYELNYEMNNRPDWVDIPLRGLLAIVAGPERAGS